MVNVIKATGEIEPFNEEKVLNSISRAGVSPEDQTQVMQLVKSKLYENIPTSEIYYNILDFLKKSPQSPVLSKFNLKKAIMDLGPTGYPFEDFVAEVLKAEGYKTKVRQILTGKCVTHEIDVVAEKDSKKITVEAKFHNTPGIKTDVQVALYTKARFDDIRETNGVDEAWIITNTKITDEVVAYANCVGMKVISWSYPAKEGLQDLIAKHNLFPITSLETLSQKQKQYLLENHAVLSRDLCENPSLLNILNLSRDQKNAVLSEAAFTCGTKIKGNLVTRSLRNIFN